MACERREYNRTGPNANAILFRDDEWSREPAIIALTTVTFQSSTGHILNADMEINSFGFNELSTREVQFVMAHEAGHFLGLDHSPEDTAVMFYRDSFDGSTEPRLSDDDVAGLCAAYPSTREVGACTFEPPKGFAADCGGNVSAACAVVPPSTSWHGSAYTGGVLLAAGVVLHRYRKRRRRTVGA
ncbi:MAG: matrixin family metalloprotease [Deltaproteobacteria bacterium]|nr:matrixin family metalloprotease [Deltaproteobacteria bacterium]